MHAPELALIGGYEWTIDNEIRIGSNGVGSNDNHASLVEMAEFTKIGEAISRIGDSQRSATPNLRAVEQNVLVESFLTALGWEDQTITTQVCEWLNQDAVQPPVDKTTERAKPHVGRVASAHRDRQGHISFAAHSRATPRLACPAG